MSVQNMLTINRVQSVSFKTLTWMWFLRFNRTNFQKLDTVSQVLYEHLHVPLECLNNGSSALVTWTIPNKLTSATLRYISMVQNSTSPKLSIPALLTRAQRPEKESWRSLTVSIVNNQGEHCPINRISPGYTSSDFSR